MLEAPFVGAGMRALVVYESMYWNTRVVASNVALAAPVATITDGSSTPGTTVSHRGHLPPAESFSKPVAIDSVS